ncbi:MAG: hypothetical protein Q7U16_12630 [Agitococcus sp.]|nr:hypothetical protein [Agitococcus sp.]
MTTAHNSFRGVSTLSGLGQFGIGALTGEACAFSLRTLCDVNEEGKALLADFFSVPELTLADSWNSSVNGTPAIGSIMLTHDVIKPLARFAFFRSGALAVVCTQQEVHGIFDASRLASYEHLEATTDSEFQLMRNPRVQHEASSPIPVSSRNVHAMSGRLN